jgi:ABC-type antimicrobial peptide transport system permease subunit
MNTQSTDTEFLEPERYELREGLHYRFQVNRREFVQVLGAGLVVSTAIGNAVAQRRGRDRGSRILSERLHLGTDGNVTVLTGKVEVGQGSRTQLTQAAAEELRGSLNPGRLERYSIFDAEAAIEQFNQQLALINTFLIGIGAVSLLVASVSILNVMLMSTIERRAEIGVLRATGFHRLDVLRLMLNEAALLGMVGAVFGVVFSILLGMLINAELLGDPLAFSAEALQYVAIGFVFGTLASFLSGLYPAWKAANSRPVEALRD